MNDDKKPAGRAAGGPEKEEKENGNKNQNEGAGSGVSQTAVLGGAGANGAGGVGKAKIAGADGQAVRPSTAGPKPTVSHMLGEITWLMSQSPTHKHFAIGDLEWLVMPAILLEQFRVFHGEKQPLGFALWAQFSEEAEERFKAQVDAGRGARLRPQDWKSGDRFWLVDLVAPQATPENKLVEAMLADLVQNVFAQRKFRFHVTDPATGKREEREIGG